MINRLLRYLRRDVKAEIKPPDLIVYDGGRVSITRYLVSGEVNYGLRELTRDKLHSVIEKYSMMLERIPDGSEIKIVKLKTDLDKILSKLTNEMLNLKAVLETVEEEHVKRRAETRLRILEKLYETIINGKPITRIVLVVKIHADGRRVEDARRQVETLSSIVKTIVYSSIGVKLVEADDRNLRRIIDYELGLSSKGVSRGIIVDTDRISTLLPAPPYKKPSLEDSGDSIPIGYDIETGWPVLIPLDMMNKHMVVIGPTGRGKTTFLASLIESIISLDKALVTSIDFKGDLASMLPPEIIETTTPGETPINILVNPKEISRLDWILMVADTLHTVLGLKRDRIVEILGGHIGEILDTETLLKNPSLTVFTPIIKMLMDKPGYDRLIELFNINTLFNLANHGTSYQNVYGGLLINIYREIIVKSGGGDRRLLVIDEAWRIARLNGLLEIIKEGRSRGVGVVLAVQNPSDIPQEILENTHLIVIFGSPNEDYRDQASRILGLPRNITSKLLYLGVGEAILLNALDPHPVVIRINKPVNT